jgi:hypothetical protein
MVLGKNHVTGLLTDHVNGCDNEKSRNMWEDRGINDTQVVDSVTTPHGEIQGLLARAERNVPASGSFAKAPSEPTVIQSQ